jgi:flagellar hook-basal body complex protein FliE
MATPINPLLPGALGAIAPTPAPRAPNVDFAQALGNAVQAAGANERTAEDMANRFANGDPNVAIDQVMISSEKASISLKYAVTLKNRAIEAYRELMNTPV